MLLSFEMIQVKPGKKKKFKKEKQNGFWNIRRDLLFCSDQ